MGGIQRQDPNLQRKLNTDLSGPAAVLLCPQCLQWIFVYSPNISPAPCTPRQTEIRIPLPSHSVSQVPLSQSQTTPRCTCRSCTLEKRPPKLTPKFDELPISLSSKASKSFQMKTLNYFKQPLELSILLCILMRHGALLCKCKFLHSFFSLAKVLLWLVGSDSNVHDIWNRAPENLNIAKYTLRISIQILHNSVQFNRKGCLCVMIVYCFLRNCPFLCFVSTIID